MGDDAAESHAFERAKRIVKSDGEVWTSDALRLEFNRQLGAAADGRCPRCATGPETCSHLLESRQRPQPGRPRHRSLRKPLQHLDTSGVVRAFRASR